MVKKIDKYEFPLHKLADGRSLPGMRGGRRE
jgi:hypothetical protein